MPQPEGERQTKQFVVEPAPLKNEEVFRELFRVEKDVSGDESLEENDLRGAYENPKAITVVLRDENKKIVGLINALPNTEVYQELSPDDPDFENNPHRLYIYDIAVEEGARSLENFLNLMRMLIEEGKQKGFTAITMHTRTSEGLSAVLQKRYGAKLMRTFENWQGWGKYEYLELDFDSPKIKTQID
jgi:ribosomal protein S18 acetylase RimI-like enzyme